VIAAWKRRARVLSWKRTRCLLASRDPRVPWYAKVFLGLVLAHTFSPIDLIPDFIPVLGYLDDLIVTPLGIALALKMIPPQVMEDARQQAQELLLQGKPVSRVGAALVIAVWILSITVPFGSSCVGLRVEPKVPRDRSFSCLVISPIRNSSFASSARSPAPQSPVPVLSGGNLEQLAPTLG